MRCPTTNGFPSNGAATTDGFGENAGVWGSINPLIVIETDERDAQAVTREFLVERYPHIDSLKARL